MKSKRKHMLIIISTLCVMTIFFSGTYYISYKAALQQFNQNAKEKNNHLLQIVEESKIKDEDDTLPVDYIDDTIKPGTRYIIETYDVKENALSKEVLGTPEYLVGLKRDEVIRYLSDYMRTIPLEDYEKGLLSYELISFSNEEIVLRKTYNSDRIVYQFYLIVLDGYVTVYYSDKKTVYEYTDIELQNLSEKEQNRLVDGFYVKDQEELYGVLESYTS